MLDVLVGEKFDRGVALEDRQDLIPAAFLDDNADTGVGVPDGPDGDAFCERAALQA